MRSTNAASTVNALSNLFTRYGFPEQVVSDNGPPFQSREYGDFLKQNGVQWVLVSPYHPAANGQAKRFVQTIKTFLKSSAADGPLHQSIQNFLLTYRSTQHATTGATPAKLFLQREIRTRLSSARPDISLKVTNNQARMKAYHDRHIKFRELSPGDRVIARDYLSNLKWRQAPLLNAGHQHHTAFSWTMAGFGTATLMIYCKVLPRNRLQLHKCQVSRQLPQSIKSLQHLLFC